VSKSPPTTLIGAPPNILISDALRDAGLRPFQLLDYTPAGVVVMLVVWPISAEI